MHDFVVSAYRSAGDRELLAIIPLVTKHDASDSELVAEAMRVLQATRRYTDAEIETFRYRLERRRTAQTPTR